MKRIAALVVALSLGLGSGTALAAEMTTIQYDLAGSTQIVTDPLAGSNPMTGTMLLRFFDNNVNSLVDSSASVMLLTAQFVVDPLVVAIVTGTFRLTLTQIATGGHIVGAGDDVARSAFGFVVGSNPGVGVQNGFIHCLATPAFCLAAANLAQSVVIPIPDTNVPFPLTIPRTQTPNVGLTNPIRFFGNGEKGNKALFMTRLSALRPFGGGLATGSFQLVGAEISRTIVDTPEPGVLSMLLFGVFGLAGTVAWPFLILKLKGVFR